MDELDLRAAKINYDNIEINDVIEFRAWCLVYAEELIAAVEASQQELAEAVKRDDAMYKVYVADKNNIIDLRAQLAEALKQLENAGIYNVDLTEATNRRV